MLNIISSSLQFTASVILMLWCLKGATKNEIIIKYFHGDNYVHTFEDGNCVLEKERLRKTAKKVYLNVYALLLLSSGYYLSFLDLIIVTEMSPITMAMVILGMCYMIGELITEFIASVIYDNDIIIKYDELVKIVNVNSNMTGKDIEERYWTVFEKD